MIDRWSYEVEGKNYIKVGGYGIDDLEWVVKDGSIYLPEKKLYYSTLEEAYTSENDKWVKEEVL